MSTMPRRCASSDPSNASHCPLRTITSVSIVAPLTDCSSVLALPNTGIGLVGCCVDPYGLSLIGHGCSFAFPLYTTFQSSSEIRVCRTPVSTLMRYAVPLKYTVTISLSVLGFPTTLFICAGRVCIPVAVSTKHFGVWFLVGHVPHRTCLLCMAGIVTITVRSACP